METQTNTPALIELPLEMQEMQKEIALQCGDGIAENVSDSYMPFLQRFKEVKFKADTFDFNDFSDENVKLAKANLKLTKTIRTDSDKRKTQVNKAYVIVQKFSNALNGQVWDGCESLENKWEVVVKHSEIQEAARLAKIKAERLAMIAPFGFVEEDMPGIETMSQVGFDSFHTGAKKNHEDKIAADKKREDEIIKAERLRVENEVRLKAENERLKKEQEEKDKLAAGVLAEQKAKADAELAQAKIASDKIAADLKSRADAEKKLADAKYKAESERAQLLAKQLKDKQDEEAKVKADAELAEKKRIAEEKKAAKAPDKTKLKKSIDDMDWHLDLNDLKSEDAKIIGRNISEKFSSFQKWALTQIETL